MNKHYKTVTKQAETDITSLLASVAHKFLVSGLVSGSLTRRRRLRRLVPPDGLGACIQDLVAVNSFHTSFVRTSTTAGF